MTFKPIKKDVDLHKLEHGEYTLDQVVDDVPKNPVEIVLGLYQNEKVFLKKGKFGLYITWGKNSKTLKELGNRPVESIKFEEIEKYLEEGSNIIRKITDHITLRKGPKGDYLFFKNQKMKKPQFFSIKEFKDDYKNCDVDKLKQWIKETYKIA
jgi:hypothetical protein